jgi:hypothetical protein
MTRAVIRRTRARPGLKATPDPEKDYARLGPPPPDPLEGYVWALDVLYVSLFHVVHDSELTERERRKEVREITRAMAYLEPKARLFDAEARVRGDEAKLADDQTGPEMIDAEKLAAQSYRASATRGRRDQ